MTKSHHDESYLIIIGAMKCGTTTLYSMLSKHPQIASATPKEPGFFAFDEVYKNGFDWYHSLFDFEVEAHRYRLDASTDYTKLPFVDGVLDRMKARKGAKFKFVYIMRHPLRRIESHASHVQLARKEIGQQVTTKDDHGLDQGISLPNLALTQYARQIAPYHEAWENGDLYLTTLEELKANPQNVLQDLWKFLDLPSPVSETEVAPHENAASNQHQEHRSWGVLARQGWLMALGRMILPQSTREWIKSLFNRKIIAVGRFRLTTAEQKAIWDALEPEIDELERTYKVPARQLWAPPDP